MENHNVTATLLEKRSGQYKNMTVDGHHLKLINNNMYNFTNVSNDYVERDYYCEACGQKKKVGGIGILESMSCINLVFSDQIQTNGPIA